MQQLLVISILILRKISIGLTVGVLGCLLAISPAGMSWEENLGLSWLFTIRGTIEPPAQVIVVNMDAGSAAKLGQSPKIRDWQRDIHAQLIDRLVNLGAYAIVFDIFFEQDRKDDLKLAAAMERAERVVLVQLLRHERLGNVVAQHVSTPPTVLTDSTSGLAPFPLPAVPHRVNQFWNFLTSEVPTLPITALQIYVLQAVGYQRFKDILNKAGVQFQLPESISDTKDLHNLMISMYEEIQTNNSIAMRIIQAIENYKNISGELDTPFVSLIEAYAAPRSQYINFYGPSRTIETIPYEKILDENNPLTQDLTGTAVFIGSLDPSPFDDDQFYTVFSDTDGTELSGVEIGATVMANLLNGDTLRYPHSYTFLALLMLFGIMVGTAAYVLRGIWTALASALGIGVCYVVSAQLFFNNANLWLPVFVPAIIQLPLALSTGLMLQYLEVRSEKEHVRRALRYHVPEYAARILSASSSPLTPKRVYGTCLMTDVARYTSLAETIPPEELVVLSNEYFDDLGECIKKHGGEMLEIAGDGLTCVWPTPYPDRDVRLQACLAALDILQAVERFNGRHPDHPFHTRIGLDAGWLAIGHMGGSGHFIYGIAGDIVNTASRIEGLNKQLKTKLLASEAVVQGLDDYLLIRPTGRYMLKGKRKILEIAEIICQLNVASSEEYVLCEEFSEALSFFSDQQWLASSKRFEYLLQRYPHDGPISFYKERSAEKLIKPTADIESFIRLESK